VTSWKPLEPLRGVGSAWCRAEQFEVSMLENIIQRWKELLTDLEDAQQEIPVAEARRRLVSIEQYRLQRLQRRFDRRLAEQGPPEVA
jgi:hypothetical protein